MKKNVDCITVHMMFLYYFLIYFLCSFLSILYMSEDLIDPFEQVKRSRDDDDTNDNDPSLIFKYILYIFFMWYGAYTYVYIMGYFNTFRFHVDGQCALSAGHPRCRHIQELLPIISIVNAKSSFLRGGHGIHFILFCFIFS